MIVVACPRNSLDSLGRLPSGISPADTSGNRSCSILVGDGPSGRSHHEFKAIGFRDGKGCQWRRENYSRKPNRGNGPRYPAKGRGEGIAVFCRRGWWGESLRERTIDARHSLLTLANT